MHTTKICTKCQVEKPIDEFYIRNKSKGTRRTECSCCVQERAKEWKQKTTTKEKQDVRREYQREWCKKNQDKRKQYAKTQANKPEIKEYRKRWNEENPDKLNEYQKRYRHSKGSGKYVPKTDMLKEEILLDYGTTMSVKNIATKYQLSASSIFKALKRWDVPKRDLIPNDNLTKGQKALQDLREKGLNNFYDIWVEKYGQEEADQRQIKWQHDRQATYDKRKANNEYKNSSWREGKSTYSLWLTKYGKEEADKRQAQLSEKHSQNTRGSNNPMYDKSPPHGAGSRGGTGWYKKHYFRSLKELTFMMDLDAKHIKWQSAEKISIPYQFDGEDMTYHPDFLLDENQIVEIKPTREMKNPKVISKAAAALLFCQGQGWSYEMKDVKPEIDKIYKAYVNGDVVFTKRYEDKFLFELMKDDKFITY